jgi:hypothetical protein
MSVKKERRRRRRSETAKLLQMVLKWRMKKVGNQKGNWSLFKFVDKEGRQEKGRNF